MISVLYANYPRQVNAYLRFIRTGNRPLIVIKYHRSSPGVIDNLARKLDRLFDRVRVRFFRTSQVK